MANILSAHNTNLTLEALKMGETFDAEELAAAELLLQSVNGLIYELSLNDIIEHEVVVEANEPKGENVQLEDPDNQWGQFLADDFDNLGEFSLLAVMNMSMLDPAESPDSLILAYGQPDASRLISLPADPDNVDAQENMSNDVDVTWSDESDNETGFEIQRKTGAGSFGALASVAADVEIYTDTTVVAATTYTYRVRANKLGFGNSAWVESPPVTTAP